MVKVALTALSRGTAAADSGPCSDESNVMTRSRACGYRHMPCVWSAEVCVLVNIDPQLDETIQTEIGPFLRDLPDYSYSALSITLI